jgi:hypothetical protein
MVPSNFRGNLRFNRWLLLMMWRHDGFVQRVAGSEVGASPRDAAEAPHRGAREVGALGGREEASSRSGPTMVSPVASLHAYAQLRRVPNVYLGGCVDY